ncbi:hypothetical protein [Sphingomonas sp. 2SG]|uniref:hypothetical protein n=1 Tax=Sphingomonas sp. 2SG TaxID=2502201 RepID=UPI0010F8F05E|nr:hypothetical protein [Sphingomonas sp. 2SG]
MMITANSIPTTNLLEQCFLIVIGRIVHVEGSNIEDSHQSGRNMIDSAQASSLRQIYGEDYIDLVQMPTRIESAISDRGITAQLKASIECHSVEHFEAVKARIVMGWNALNGLAGVPYVGRCDSASEASAFIKPEWRGLL